MEKNEITLIPQLKCVEGKVVTHVHTRTDGKRPKSGRRSARRSARRSKSRQAGADLGDTEASSSQAKTGKPGRTASEYELDEKLMGKRASGGEQAAESEQQEVAGQGQTEGQAKPTSTGQEDKKEEESLEGMSQDIAY